MSCRKLKVRIHFLASVFAVLTLNIGSIPEASASQVSPCLSTLLQPPRKDSGFRGLFKIRQTEYPDKPTVVESSRDQHGLIEIARIHRWGWGSNHRSPGAQDMMGNPQWILFAFGLEAAEWMGVRQLGERTMTIFDGERARNVVTTLNQQMIKMNLDPLPIQFYQLPPNVGLQDIVPYLTLFSDSGSLPISGEFNSLVHDFSYHFSSIITPPVVIKLMRIQTRFILKFVEHLSSTSLSFESQTQRDHIKRIENLLLTAQGKHIDAATALFPRLLNGEDNSFSFMLVAKFGSNCSDGKTSGEHVAEVIKSVTRRWPAGSTQEDMEIISRRLSEELEAFSNLHQNDSDFKFSFEPDAAELPETLTRRRDQVLRAIEAIKHNLNK
ncbi:MAG: hypothetical protein IPJ71_17180 [Bdellovibrionales bacterium]|nr:hypothetical protein [Bdellovibrionales bacterium]